MGEIAGDELEGLLEGGSVCELASLLDADFIWELEGLL